MKRTGHLFERVTDFSNLYGAFQKALRGSGKTPAACRFHFHLEKELLRLKADLESGSYRPARYRYFRIQDPKARIISVAPFRDRVVHHALVRVLEPVFEPVFIADSYATRKGKGTHRAIRQAQSFLRKNCYYLKVDIKQYFPSIDHNILRGLIEKKVKDRRLTDLVEKILDNSDASRGVCNKKGLPIGNLTSQFFANIYLDPLDHFIKDGLGFNGYIRYMDDMAAFSDSNTALKDLLRQIEHFLKTRLDLGLKPEATRLHHRMHGMDFLGFRIYPNLIRVKKKSLFRMKKCMEKRFFEFQTGGIEPERYVMSVRSLFEHVSHADSFRLRSQDLVLRAGGI